MQRRSFHLFDDVITLAVAPILHRAPILLKSGIRFHASLKLGSERAIKPEDLLQIMHVHGIDEVLIGEVMLFHMPAKHDFKAHSIARPVM